MSNANIKDIKLIEVKFLQNSGKRQPLKIELTETILRGDALKIAAAIKTNNDVFMVNCYTVKGSFI